MNERIMELAKEAAAAEGWGPEVWQSTFAEKLAELIALECADIVESLVYVDNDGNSILESDSIRLEIAEHFGIE